MTPRGPPAPDSRREASGTLRERFRRSSSKRVAVVALVVGLGVLALATGVAFSQSTPSAPATEANDSSVAPGAAFASAIANERLQLDGEIERTALATQLSRATSDDERVRIVATAIERLEARLADLETRSRNSQQTTDQGGLTSQTGVESVAPEARSIDRTLDRLRMAATDLPVTQFEAQYTNTSSIEQLDGRASVLASGETTATPTSAASTSRPDTSSVEPGPTEDASDDDSDDDDDEDDDRDDDDDDDDEDDDDDGDTSDTDD